MKPGGHILDSDWTHITAHTGTLRREGYLDMGSEESPQAIQGQNEKILLFSS